MIVWIVLGIVLLIVILFISYYNKFMVLKNQIDEAWSSIDVQLKRRYDLIPNLVEIVKGYASHEKETLTKVIEARSKALGAKTIDEKIKFEGELTGPLKSLLMLTENYPDLKANENFIQLQKELVNIEDHIQNARRYYNAVVRDYNTMLETFPSVLVANMLKLEKRPYFEIEEQERENVKIKF